MSQQQQGSGLAGSINRWITNSSGSWGQKVKAGKFALNTARHLDTRLARPAYDAHLWAQKTADLATQNPKTAGLALAGVLGTGLLGGLAAKYRNKKQQKGSGLVHTLLTETELGPRLDIAGWQARIAAEHALKHLPKLAAGAALLASAAGAGAYGLKKRKKQRGSGRKRGRVSKRRQKGAGFLRKIPLLGNILNALL